jgi:hypothetical protein
MDQPSKKINPNQDPTCPVVGTPLTKSDLNALARGLKELNSDEVFQLMEGFSDNEQQQWSMDELSRDFKLMQLEDLVDDSLLTDDDSDSAQVEEEDFGIHYNVTGLQTDAPIEIRHFLTSLDKLVKRTQVQLRKYNKKR